MTDHAVDRRALVIGLVATPAAVAHAMPAQGPSEIERLFAEWREAYRIEQDGFARAATVFDACGDDGDAWDEWERINVTDPIQRTYQALASIMEADAKSDRDILLKFAVITSDNAMTAFAVLENTEKMHGEVIALLDAWGQS